MDPTRFDTLTQAITAWATRLPTRRGMLHAAVGGLVALAMQPAAETSAKKKKKPKLSRKDKQRRICQKKFGPGLGTFCNGSSGVGCFDLLNDPAHCGLCGTACAAGQTCQGGRCTGSGNCTPNCAGKACGADNGCGDICALGSCPSGQTCRNDGVCVAGGCNPACGYNTTCQGNVCVPQPNHCPTPFVCAGFGGDAPVCGSVVGPGGVVGSCGCYSSTEGNAICVNQVEASGEEISFSDLVPCNSSQDCRNTVGLHWFCRAVNRNGSGQTCGSAVGRCWPECDSPSVFRRGDAEEAAASGAPRRRKANRRKRGRGRGR